MFVFVDRLETLVAFVVVGSVHLFLSSHRSVQLSQFSQADSYEREFVHVALCYHGRVEVASEIGVYFSDFLKCDVLLGSFENVFRPVASIAVHLLNKNPSDCNQCQPYKYLQAFNAHCLEQAMRR